MACSDRRGASIPLQRPSEIKRDGARQIFVRLEELDVMFRA
jgi:hypothetical protein